MLRWMMPQISLDVIELTLVPSASKTVILNDFTAPFACVVDWGDNTFSAISANVPLSHTYADASPRTVILRGSLGGFWNNSSATGKTLLTAVNTIKSRSLLSLSNTFRACTSLNSVVSSFDAPNLNNLQYSFYQCASITSALPPLWQAFPGVAHAGCFTQSCKTFWGQYGTGCGHRQYVAAVPGRTYYQQFGTGCSKRGYVAAVPGKSWYQQYGTGCGKRSFVAGSAAKMYYSIVGSTGYCPKRHPTGSISYSGRCWQGDCEDKPLNEGGSYKYISDGNDCNYSTTTRSIVQICSRNPTHKRTAIEEVCGPGCTYQYSAATAGYYVCSSGGACKETGCTVAYSSTQPAYYTCTSGGNCRDSACTITYTSGQSAYYRCARSGASCATSGCAYPYANEESYNAARNAGWA